MDIGFHNQEYKKSLSMGMKLMTFGVSCLGKSWKTCIRPAARGKDVSYIYIYIYIYIYPLAPPCGGPPGCGEFRSSFNVA